MRSGKLRHRINIESISETKDDFGGHSQSGNNVETRSASIEPLSGRELTYAQGIASEASYKITIRWRDGIDTQHRIKFGNRIFHILAKLNTDERNRELILLCKEVI